MRIKDPGDAVYTAANNPAACNFKHAISSIPSSVFTATILKGRHLLKEDKYKDISIGSLRWLVFNKRVKI